MSIEIVEGILTVDKQKKRISANSEESANDKLKEFMIKNKNYNPKVSSKKPRRDSSGIFYYDVTFDKTSKEDDNSLYGRLKRGVSAVKKAVDDIPTQKKLSAPTQRKLSNIMKQFQSEFPNAKFGKIRKDEDGQFIVLVNYTKEQTKKEPEEDNTETPTEKPTEKNTKRISNIQKQLANLSPEALHNVEQYVIKALYKN